MRLGNPLFFTENHRFAVFRDFSPGPADGKMLASAYQPMVGAGAIGLYSLMVHQLPAERTGWSNPELQRKLFHGLAVEPNPEGRAAVARYCSLLEAVGLLRTETAEQAETEELIYVYRLYPPLKPAEFFATEHLRLLLRDKIGERAMEALMRELWSDKPEELADPYLIRQDLTMPFYEVFTLAGDKSANIPVAAPEEAIDEYAAPLPPIRFAYEQIASRVPKSSVNRRHVERLSAKPGIIAQINYYADKYGLTLTNIAEVLDFDGVFDPSGTFDERVFERQAELIYLQRYKHEEQVAIRLSALDEIAATAADQAPRAGRPAGKTGQAGPREPVPGSVPAGVDLPVDAEKSGSRTGQSGGGEAAEADALLPVPDRMKDKLDVVAYNELLKREPHTKVLQLFIGTPKVMGETKEMFRKLNIVYRFPDEVLNALIHYLQTNNKPWNETYINKVAASLQARQIRTFEQAARYFNAERQTRPSRQEGGTKTERLPGAPGGKSGVRGKPRLPVYKAPSGKLPSEAKQELDEIVKYLEGRN